MSIIITLNGEKEEIEDDMTIAQLLQKKKIRPEIVTVERNDKIIERRHYENIHLQPGDTLEFVYYMGGGAEKGWYDNISQLIGNTPLVNLKNIRSPNMPLILGKMESFNPGGSVKDRICLSMIEDAEKKGILSSQSTIIEPTSGNTGIGLAMICAVKGYRCILTMPETMSLERIYLLKSYQAEVVLTPGKEGMQGAMKKAEELQKKIPRSYIPYQFKNMANPAIHEKTTAKEIWEALNGKIDAFIAGVGTGGTITGTGKGLKARKPDIRIIAVEPKGSAVLSGQKSGPHKIQGIGTGFIPEILDQSIYEEIITVSDHDAFLTTRQLSSKEGILCGISSGAAVFAALKVAKKMTPSQRIVVMLPDTGERYFSMEQYFEA